CVCPHPGSIVAEQRRQSLREVAGGDTLKVKDRQQRLDRFRAAHVRRQDRRREPDAVGVGSVRLAIAYTRLADGDWTDTGHHLAFRQVTVAHDALVAVRSLQIAMLAEKVRDLGLDRLGQQSTRPIAQDFGELIVDVSWLNQLDDVIFGHGISLLRWRSGGVRHPHDMPPSRFEPSPTSGDSSIERSGSHSFSPHLSAGLPPMLLAARLSESHARGGIALAGARWWIPSSLARSRAPSI